MYQACSYPIKCIRHKCEAVGEKSYRRHIQFIQRFLKEEPPQYRLVKQYDRILIHGCDVWTFEFPAFQCFLSNYIAIDRHWTNSL